DTWRHVRRVACWRRSGVIPYDIGAVAVSPEDVGAAQAALEIRAPARLAAGAHGQQVWGRLCDRISRTELAVAVVAANGERAFDAGVLLVDPGARVRGQIPDLPKHACGAGDTRYRGRVRILSGRRSKACAVARATPHIDRTRAVRHDRAAGVAGNLRHAGERSRRTGLHRDRRETARVGAIPELIARVAAPSTDGTVSQYGIGGIVSYRDAHDIGKRRLGGHGGRANHRIAGAELPIRIIAPGTH